MPKLWIGERMYSVESEVQEYCDKLEAEIEQWKNKAIGYKCDLDDLMSKSSKRIEELETALQEIIEESGDIDHNKWPTQQQKCQAIAQVALKG